jgi:predicted negative regulator of RcsB-dependent stress response
MLLAYLALVAARAGRSSRATAALGELDAEAALTPAVQALGLQARAETACVARDFDAAAGTLRAAVAVRQELGCRTPASHARLRLAGVLIEKGELESALLELATAEQPFAGLGATALADRCRRRLPMTD